VEETLALGANRVVLGTIALTDPDLVREAAARFPGRVAVGLDARDGRVAVSGWLETSGTDAVEAAKRFADAGVAALIHTDIARDGTLAGPNLEATARLAEAVGLPVIASGGVGSEDHVRAAARLAPRGVVGIIVGRALYTGALDLARALEIAACS
jgi:phosphoribosylformimino-5-aminoimidazole carboxamide ribotide isomerase